MRFWHPISRNKGHLLESICQGSLFDPIQRLAGAQVGIVRMNFEFPCRHKGWRFWGSFHFSFPILGRYLPHFQASFFLENLQTPLE